MVGIRGCIHKTGHQNLRRREEGRQEQATLLEPDALPQSEARESSTEFLEAAWPRRERGEASVIGAGIWNARAKWNARSGMRRESVRT